MAQGYLPWNLASDLPDAFSLFAFRSSFSLRHVNARNPRTKHFCSVLRFRVCVSANSCWLTPSYSSLKNLVGFLDAHYRTFIDADTDLAAVALKTEVVNRGVDDLQPDIVIFCQGLECKQIIDSCQVVLLSKQALILTPLLKTGPRPYARLELRRGFDGEQRIKGNGSHGHDYEEQEFAFSHGGI